MDVERETALAIIENRIDQLSDGSFVVCTSAKDFATVCMSVKGHLFNVPVQASESGYAILLPCPPHSGCVVCKEGQERSRAWALKGYG